MDGIKNCNVPFGNRRLIAHLTANIRMAEVSHPLSVRLSEAWRNSSIDQEATWHFRCSPGARGHDRSHIFEITGLRTPISHQSIAGSVSPHTTKYAQAESTADTTTAESHYIVTGPPL